MFLRQLLSRFALALLGAASCAAHAQVDPWALKNCPSLQQDASKTLMNACSEHAGCALMIAQFTTCPRIQGFLTRLDGAMPPQAAGALGFLSRRTVTPEAVWEASMPEAMKALESKAEWKEMAQRIQRGVAPGNSQFRTGTLKSGAKFINYTAEDPATGMRKRTMFFSNGLMERGAYREDNKGTELDQVGLSGFRTILLFSPDGLSAQSRKLKQGGAEYVGSVNPADWAELQGTLTIPDGRRWEGNFANGMIQSGKEFRANGTLAASGTFEKFELAVGARYDDAGATVVENIDKEKVRADAAAAARDLAERQKRDQEAARAAEEQQRREAQARADKEFRAGLAKLNAGQLFTRSQDLRATGETARANEVARNLIERFPNHSLAATAAQQMAGISPAPQASAAPVTSGTPARASAAAGRKMMTCWEAIKEIRDALNSAGNERRFLDTSTGRQINEQILWVTNLYTRASQQLPHCANDSELRQRFENDLAATRRNCPERTQGSPNCTLGVNHYIDEKQVQAVFQQLMAGAGPAATAAAAPAKPAPSDTADAACAAGINRVNDVHARESAKIPASSVVIRAEALLWMLQESFTTAEKQCPGSDSYRRQALEWRKTFASTKEVCDRASSRGPCVARLPVAEQVARPPTPQTVAQRPPENKPPASCSSATGANWLVCQRQACASVSGQLTVRGSCVSCQAPGNSFNACPPGQGYNSAQ